jgi:hypothetical protein
MNRPEWQGRGDREAMATAGDGAMHRATASAAGRANQELDAVGTIHRAAHARR